MIQIGQYNTLRVLRHVDFGAYLEGDEDTGDILLPRKYLSDNTQVGDTLKVFICYDSEDRLVATTETPQILLGQFAALQVVSLTATGAFLHWGLPKDLFLPFAEQTHRLHVGETVVVFLYLDNTNRLAASMRLGRNLEKTPGNYEEGQSVDLLISGKTELGYKAVINGRHEGLLYFNEVFQPLSIGQKIQGYIKYVRPADGKIDLRLQRTGHQGGEEIAPQILALLEKSGGFLPINDKTSAEEIHRLFGTSKKKYKIALGGLYKKRLITVSEDGVRLISKKS